MGDVQNEWFIFGGGFADCFGTLLSNIIHGCVKFFYSIYYASTVFRLNSAAKKVFIVVWQTNQQCWWAGAGAAGSEVDRGRGFLCR